MTKQVPKLLNLATLFLFLFASFSAQAHHFEAINSDGDTIYYNITGSNTVGVTYRGAQYNTYENEYVGVINIPSNVTYNGTVYTVTSIGDHAFCYCRSLVSVEIPSSVTSIENYAFLSCSSLTSVEIPSSVTSIENYAFLSCSSLTSVEIPSSVTTIGNYAFSGCSSLTSVEIPSSVTTIGNDAFSGCSSLASVEIPTSVTTIGNDAFSGCSSLTSVEIPSSVTSIGNSAFSNCRSLTSVEIPSSVTSIGNFAFNKVRNISYYGTATGSPWGALSMNGYVEGYLVYSDSSKTNLLGCSAAAINIIIPSSVTSIENYAFLSCSSLTSVEIPSSVTSIGNYAFYDCSSLTSVEIPSSVTSIGNSAFSYCSSLTSVEIPSSVILIGNYAFDNCNSLTSVEIPSSVSWIEGYAFSNCLLLDTVIIETICNLPYDLFGSTNNTTSIDYLVLRSEIPLTVINGSSIATSIYGISENAQIYVPCASIDDYRNHNVWDQYQNYHGLRVDAEEVRMACDSFTCIDGNTYTADTVVVYAIPNSICDSVVTLTLTINPTYQHTDAVTLCDDMLPYSYGDSLLNAAGQYAIGFSTIHNCDSVVTLGLTVNPTYQHTDAVTLCDDMLPYSYEGRLFYSAGQHVVDFTSIHDCDSVFTLNLTVNPTYQHNDALTLCDDMLPYSYGNSLLTTAGQHVIQFSTTNNCDSVITLGLTVNLTYEEEDYMTICQSSLPIVYGDAIFDEATTSGNYAVMMTSQQGCDSLIVLGLNVNPSEVTQLQMVTVENNLCKVAWQKQAAVEHYNIYREGTGVNPFDLVATVPFDAAPYWVDSTTNPKSRLYRYKITSVDSCGVESPLSESHATIHLIIADGVENSHNLIWNPYEGAAYTYYRIYRGRQEHNQVLIDSVPASYTTYSDYDDPSAHVFYSVAAVLVDGEAKSVVEVRSNTASPDEVGIEDIATTEQTWQLRGERGVLIVQGAEGEILHVYDAYGRLLKSVERATEEERYEVPAAGLYIVKRQGGESKKITLQK